MDPIRQLEECDLVMKGGITSGVVYPRAITQLGERYRLRNVGGTSAGAIAAAVAAAAEYGRQTGAAADLSRIEGVVDDLTRKGFLMGLFQPAPGTRPLWEVLHSAALPASTGGRARRTLAAVLRARRPVAGAGVAALTALAVLAVLALVTLDTVAGVLAVVTALLLAVMVATATVVLAAARVARDGYGALRASTFGFCPGVQQPGGTGPALMEWLHGHIQACAGLGEERPLTFAMLEGEKVALEMLTTDLGFARPLRCRHDLGAYAFRPDELRAYLPEPVIAAMVAASDALPESGGLRTMPTDHLPVLAAVRLSLSFPGLLSAVPLYRDGARHLFSDGGIASNFPIHFFDALLPSRPTFGLDLAEYPASGGDPVVLPTDPAEPARPRWSEVRGGVDFLVRIKDTMQNWRDTTQAELPGYRERICQIRLTRKEGGLNLDMDPDAIQRLVGYGEIAGDRLREEFSFGEHRWIRFLTAMRLLQPVLQDAATKFDGFADELAAGMPEARSFRAAYPAAWCPPAGDATRSLLAVARGWGPPPAFSFDAEEGRRRARPCASGRIAEQAAGALPRRG